jgi:hypothetical protein
VALACLNMIAPGWRAWVDSGSGGDQLRPVERRRDAAQRSVFVCDIDCKAQRSVGRRSGRARRASAWLSMQVSGMVASETE